MTFDRRLWLESIYCDNAKKIVIQKASQIGITEWMLTELFCLAKVGVSGMYVLPTKDWRNTFVPNRIDKAIQYVDEYRANCNTGYKDAHNKGMKTLYGRNWKFVGANAVNDFYEFPAGAILIDERDRCDSNNLVYAFDRLGAAEDPIVRIIGNPTIEGFGVAHEYDQSDQRSWLVKCEHCGEWQPLDWFVNVVEQLDDGTFRAIDSSFHSPSRGNGGDMRAYCRRCKKSIERLAAGEWVAKHPDIETHGYQVSKIFGDPRSRDVIAEMYKEFIASQANPTALQRFYNNILGVPYEAAGAKINDSMLQACAVDYEMPPMATGTIAGVDVGSILHVHISTITPDGKRRKIFIGTTPSFDGLSFLCKQYGITRGVIDAMPETHACKEFVRSHPGWLMCYYRPSEDKKLSVQADYVNAVVQVDRTESLDSGFAAVTGQQLEIPLAWRQLDNGDFAKQMKAPTRIYDEDRGRFIWDEGGQADHHRHADNYELIAAKLGAGIDLLVI